MLAQSQKLTPEQQRSLTVQIEKMAPINDPTSAKDFKDLLQYSSQYRRKVINNFDVYYLIYPHGRISAIGKINHKTQQVFTTGVVY